MFKNKKAQSEVAILITILAFQIFIITALGFINITPETNSYSEPITGFSFLNIITSISVLGWANILIFSPLISGLVYIVARLVRGGG